MQALVWMNTSYLLGQNVNIVGSMFLIGRQFFCYTSNMTCHCLWNWKVEIEGKIQHTPLDKTEMYSHTKEIKCGEMFVLFWKGGQFGFIAGCISFWISKFYDFVNWIELNLTKLYCPSHLIQQLVRLFNIVPLWANQIAGPAGLTIF